jgi:hypothetical protein
LPSLVLVSLLPQPPAQPTQEDMQRYFTELLQYTPYFALIWIVVVLIVVPVTNAAVIHAIARAYLGEPVTVKEALQFGFSRLLPVLGTSILVYLLMLIGFVLCVLPSLLFAIWFGISLQVVVIEGISGPSALSRSKRLAAPHWKTFSALYLVLFVLTTLLNGSAQLIPQPHAQVVLASLVNAATGIIWQAAFVVFYFSCRCAEENFDLHYLAQAMGSEPPEADDQVLTAPR